MARFAASFGPKRFRRWLEGQQPREIVGQSCSHRDCPLARFVTQQFDVVYATAEPQWLGVMTPQGLLTRRRTRPWERRFILGIDRIPAGVRSVTAEEALDALDQAMETADRRQR